MKLLRSELVSGFKEKLFEININDLPTRGINFSDRLFTCTLTSSTMHFGFQISGCLAITVKYNCDRCLSSFDKYHNLPLNLQFTSEQELLGSHQSEMVYFSDNDDSIDISHELADIIGLARPMKSLCINRCEGLCNLCGINLNKLSCDCLLSKDNDVLKALENIKLD